MGWGGGGEGGQKQKRISSKSFEKYSKSALPSAQKKNPIPGEDGELHLKKLSRVITQQNQEIDLVNPTWR